MNNLNEKFSNIEEQMKEMNQRVESEIMDLKSQMSFFIKSMNESLKAQTNEIQNALFLSESSIRTDLNETGKVIGKGFIFTKESISVLNNKLNDLRGGHRYGEAAVPLPALPAPSRTGDFTAVDLEVPASANSNTKLVNTKDKKK